MWLLYKCDLRLVSADFFLFQPGDFVHTIGDAHVYVNHVDALKEQVWNPPSPSPKFNWGQQM